MLPILEVGPLAIQTPGLVLLVGVWIGLSLAERHAKFYLVNPNELYNLALISIIAGLVGARLAYLARYSQAFSASPISLISLNPGLLDPIGGAGIGTVAGFVYGQRKGLPFWKTLDALTSVFAVLMIAFGLAHLASGSAYGSPTALPWGLELWGARRQPSQLYEILAAAAILGLVWPSQIKVQSNQPGFRFLSFLALSAGARLFLEAFRGDSTLLPNGLRIAQLAAWGLLALSLWGLGLRQDKTRS